MKSILQFMKKSEDSFDPKIYVSLSTSNTAASISQIYDLEGGLITNGPNFIMDIGGGVHGDSIYSDNEYVYVGGRYNRVVQEGVLVNRSGFARFNKDEFLNNTSPTGDSSLVSGAGPTYTQVIKPDGNNIYLGGHDSFRLYNKDAWQLLNSISVSTSFGSAVVSTVDFDDNYVYIGGNFETVSGQSRNRLARFNKSNMSLDSWNPITGTSSFLEVKTINSNNQRLYVGGISIGSIDGQSSQNIVIFDKSNMNFLTSFGTQLINGSHIFNDKVYFATSTGVFTIDENNNYSSIVSLSDCTDIYVG